MKRFVVDEQSGFSISGGEIRWQYDHHWFDTYSEARKFVMSHPRKDLLTDIIDTERLPF